MWWLMRGEKRREIRLWRGGDEGRGVGVADKLDKKAHGRDTALN